MAQKVNNFPLKGNGKEIRKQINNMLDLSEKGLYKNRNDYALGINKENKVLWCIQYCNTFKENMGEYKKIDLRSRELKEVSFWKQSTGIEGEETVYKDKNHETK